MLLDLKKPLIGIFYHIPGFPNLNYSVRIYAFVLDVFFNSVFGAI